MKKFFGIALAFLAMFTVPMTAHAMTQNNLGGKVYLVDNGSSSNNTKQLMMFNQNGTKYITEYVNIDDAGNIVNFPTDDGAGNQLLEYSHAIGSKKGYYASDNLYSVNTKNNQDYLIKGNQMKLGNDWGTIKGDSANEFTVTYNTTVGGIKAKTPRVMHFRLANQQYNYKW